MASLYRLLTCHHLQVYMCHQELVILFAFFLRRALPILLFSHMCEPSFLWTAPLLDYLIVYLEIPWKMHLLEDYLIISLTSSHGQSLNVSFIFGLAYHLSKRVHHGMIISLSLGDI
jgi:hypothetical protein